MKNSIIIVILLAFQLANAQKSITIKSGTGTYSSSGSGNSIFFDVRDYGAIGDGTTNNTTAIQAALNAAHVKGGIVTVPAGTFKTNKLTTYWNVKILGSGFSVTFLKSIGTDTMIVVRGTIAATTYYNHSAYFEDIAFNGDNKAIVGAFLDGVNNFQINRILMYDMTQVGLLLKTSLIGTINSSTFYNCVTGIKSIGGGGNNQVAINDGVLNANTKWAIDWSGGGQLYVNRIDAETNGSATDTLSGVIYFHGNTWPGGLHVNGGWQEQTLGRIFVIDANTSGTSNYPNYNFHSIRDFQDLGHNFSFTKANVSIRGTNQKLLIQSSSLTGAVNNIIADGTNVIVTLDNVTLDGVNSNLIRGAATITVR